MQIGEDNVESDEDETPAKKQPLNEPQEGSYERFMTTFGSPGRWAGH